LPERLEWLLLSRERDSREYHRSVEASGRLSNIAQLWPEGLERLWLSHLIVDFRDLDLIADKLPGLETLMIRLPPTKYPVSGLPKHSQRRLILTRHKKYHTDNQPQRIAKFLQKLPRLRVFHLQIAPETQTMSNDTLFSLEDMQLIAREAGPRLAQIGFFNRIFMVRRKKTSTTEAVEERPKAWARIDPPEDEPIGPSTVQIMVEHEEVYLEPWKKGSLSVPEIFQVWRV
jgi:hypothetical protein